MGKNKIARFRENATFALLHQPSFDDLLRGDFALKGRWHSDFFRNGHPIVLELGCGRGEYTVALAQMFPQKNFIGIDIKGARLWRGAKTATEAAMGNVAFVRTKIEAITSLFAPHEVSEIWLTFPDPQPGKHRKRLCAPMFLNRYAQLLQPDGLVHLKTDSRLLHEYLKAVLAGNGLAPIEATADLYASHSDSVLGIKTAYEQLFIAGGYPITYLKFAMPANMNFHDVKFEYDGEVPKAKTRTSRTA